MRECWLCRWFADIHWYPLIKVSATQKKKFEAVHRVLYPSTLMESLVDGKSLMDKT